jgi:hypothetical protein
MARFEIFVDIITDAQREAYEETYDESTGEYTGTLIPNREYLDTYGEDAIDITFQVADVRTLDRKSSSYSKTISLPDTDHNRRVFENIHFLGFDGGFNPKRKVKCYVLVDTIMVFEGYMQLQDYQFDAINGPSYNVILTSTLRDFKDSIGMTLLQDLPWGGINEYWNYQYVMDSWNPAITKEVFYPLIDYGWNLKTQSLGAIFGGNYADYTLSSPGSLINSEGISLFTENFYPAVYLKSYVDRIFSKAGYTYRSEFFNSEFFSKLIVPYNGGRNMLRYDVNDAGNGTFAEDKTFNVGRSNDVTLFAGSPVTLTTDYFALQFNDETTSPFRDPYGFWNTSTNTYRQVRSDIYQQKFELDLRFYIKRISTGAPINLWDSSTWPSAGVYDTQSISILFCRKSTPFSSSTDIGDSQIEYYIKKPAGSPAALPEYAHEYGILTPGSGNAGTKVVIDTLIRNESYHDYGMDSVPLPSATQIVALQPGEYVRWVLKIEWDDIGGAVPAISISQDRKSTLSNEVSLNVIYGEKIDIGNVVPQNVKCYDFMTNLINLFNLYIETDKEDDSILIIEPRKDFINSGATLDWSEKVDLSDSINMKIVAETQNKFTLFKWNTSNTWGDKDYKTKTGYTFGEWTYNSVNDYASGENTITSLFAPSISYKVPGGLDPNYDNLVIEGSRGIIIPNFVEDVKTPVYKGFPDADFKQGNVRIMFAVKRMNCVFSTVDPYRERFYFGIQGYGYETTQYLPGGVVAGGFPSGYSGVMDWYPYAGNLDDLYNPTFDFNWGTPLAIYYDLTNGRSYSYNNLVSEYWWDYLEELNNKTSRILTLTMKLNPSDIANFSFKDKIFIRVNHSRLGFNGGAYFTVNRISGYNPSTNDPCKVELLLLGNPGIQPVSAPPSGAGGSIPGGGSPISAPPPSS